MKSMQNFSIRALLVSAALCIAPLFAQAQTSLADINQDLSLLKREVGSLRSEVEQLRRENAALAEKLRKAEASSTSNDATVAQINAAKAEMRASNEAMRRDIIAQVKKEMDSMASQTNQNMQKLASAIDSRPQAALPTSFSEDYPKTGISYVVKSGDSLSRIAKENSSKIKWIQDANKITDPNRGLRVGETIFVPQQ